MKFHYHNTLLEVLDYARLITIFIFTNIITLTVAAQSREKPNIIIILSDDQGWGDLSINGNKNLSTPNIDRLAKTGATLDRFYVSPVCSPTRAEMLTGRYHVRCGVSDVSNGGERLNLDETTIGDVLKSAGYATAAYGKWHNGSQYPYHPNARGFDDFYGFCSGHWGNYFSPVLERNGAIVKGNGFIIDDLTEKAMDFMETNKNKPFLLYLPYNTPHSPMQVPDEWWNRFKNKKLSMTSGRPDEDDAFTKAALAMCENIDWNVGRILKKLKQLKIEDNTIVIYFSDNGPNAWRWNGGMKGKKGITDEGGVRSPAFIRWPKKIKPGIKIVPITAAIDLLPTITDLAGVQWQSQKTLDGVSLKPLLLQQKVNWEDRFIFSHWKGKTSVRSQQYRLDDQGRLFDIYADPGQKKNIRPTAPAIANRLQDAVTGWEKKILSELPEKDTRPFTFAHPAALYTILPAGDGVPHGNIERSNKFPNCSFFTNWISTDDKITWELDALESGDFDVALYYTCEPKDVGSVFTLKFGADSITSKITAANDPPLQGMENDRAPRTESYVKDFKKLQLGRMHFQKGKGTLTLQASQIPGKQVMDVQMLVFKSLR